MKLCCMNCGHKINPATWFCCCHGDCRDIDMAEFLADDDEVVKAHKHTMYDLVANICHDGQPGTEGGGWRGWR